MSALSDLTPSCVDTPVTRSGAFNVDLLLRFCHKHRTRGRPLHLCSLALFDLIGFADGAVGPCCSQMALSTFVLCLLKVFASTGFVDDTDEFWTFVR